MVLLPVAIPPHETFRGVQFAMLHVTAMPVRLEGSASVTSSQAGCGALA